MDNVQDPRNHVNEEPSNDFIDTALGFGVFFGFMLVVFTVAVIIKYAIS
ncbi:YqzM family protein [Paenibacillus darwinianus]|nr:YqzM family protein [Paenibacillus darwinianus]